MPIGKLLLVPALHSPLDPCTIALRDACPDLTAERMSYHVECHLLAFSPRLHFPVVLNQRHEPGIGTVDLHDPLLSIHLGQIVGRTTLDSQLNEITIKPPK